MYTPPFTVSAKAIHLVADISAGMERYMLRTSRGNSLRLRKANRIKTIRSSLAIEGNPLTEGEVRDVLEGRPVIAPPKEIQEVRNAIRAYELYPSLDAFSLEDLLKAHHVMMQALSDDAGHFRRGGVGVYEGSQLIHMAPPADRVAGLMADLFEWLQRAEDHLLIRSCVFHYEFEFIHPFSDGNGRMGRLWQSLILGKLNPAFAHLPIENLVFAHQQAYYDALSASSARADCSPFIDFMLQSILDTLQQHASQSSHVGENVGENVGVNVGVNVGANSEETLNPLEQRILEGLRHNGYLTARELAAAHSCSQRQAERALASLKKQGIILREGSPKKGCWQIVAPTGRKKASRKAT